MDKGADRATDKAHMVLTVRTPSSPLSMKHAHSVMQVLHPQDLAAFNSLRQ